MKAFKIRQGYWRVLLLFAFGHSCAGRAQVFTTVFTNLHSFNGSDGAWPVARLLLSNNTLYGTTQKGGLLSYGALSTNGTIFAINTDGTGFRKLRDFTGGTDGKFPQAGLILSGGRLYGTVSFGGNGGSGTIFAVGTNGDSFTVLHSFTPIWGGPAPGLLVYSNSGGAYPFASLVLASNRLCGTATRGGILGQGTLFSVTTNGTGFTNLCSISAGSGPTGLLLVSNTLYGEVTGSDGLNDLGDYGSIFRIPTEGGNLTTLHSFSGLQNGFWPRGSLILLNGTLFGSTMGKSSGGGLPEGSVVYKVDTNDTEFQILHTFDQAGLTNNDGTECVGLVCVSNTLYGTCSLGGRFGSGTIFSLKTNGTEFTVLYSFSALDPFTLRNSDGANPSELIMSGNTLYGTAAQGGVSGDGTIFSVSLIPVTAPLVTNQPASRTNIAGTTAKFTVGASGTQPLAYQWFKGSSPLSQQTASTLSLTNVSDADAATYTVSITNASGTVTSATASLTIVDRPRLTLAASPSNTTLMWPTAAVTFTLHYSTNLAAPIVWTPVSPGPILINGQNIVTNLASDRQRFYRLKQ